MSSAYKVHEMSKVLSETEFRQTKEKFDELRGHTNMLQYITNSVEVSHSVGVKNLLQCCELAQSLESLENLFRKLRSATVNFEMARNDVENIQVYVRRELNDMQRT